MTRSLTFSHNYWNTPPPHPPADLCGETWGDRRLPPAEQREKERPGPSEVSAGSMMAASFSSTLPPVFNNMTEKHSGELNQHLSHHHISPLLKKSGYKWAAWVEDSPQFCVLAAKRPKQNKQTKSSHLKELLWRCSLPVAQPLFCELWRIPSQEICSK